MSSKYQNVIALEYYAALISAVSGSKTLRDAQPEKTREAQQVAGADKSRQLGRFFWKRNISVKKADRRETTQATSRADLSVSASSSVLLDVELFYEFL